MTIEITSPEIETLIRRRMVSGAFSDAEAVILHALRTSTASEPMSGKDLVAAMQSSPHREIEIEPERERMPIRDISN